MPTAIVHLRKVVIAQDLGQSLEIESGIEPTDKIIINPSDSIADGDHVQIAAAVRKAARGRRDARAPHRVPPWPGMAAAFACRVAGSVHRGPGLQAAACR